MVMCSTLLAEDPLADDRITTVSLGVNCSSVLASSHVNDHSRLMSVATDVVQVTLNVLYGDTLGTT